MYSKKELKAFESKIIDLYEEGSLPFLMHFCGGNEDWLINFFKNNIREDDYVFSTHRSHYHYLLAGGSEDRLLQLIKDGDSMFIFDKTKNFFTSSLLAGNASIAAGVALALKLQGSDRKVWCFLGDGAEDEGNFYEAVCMVDGQDLPCTFIIEDNNRSVETTKRERKGNNCIIWPGCVVRYCYDPIYPHAGTNSKKHIKFKKECYGRFANI